MGCVDNGNQEEPQRLQASSFERLTAAIEAVKDEIREALAKEWTRLKLWGKEGG